MSSRADLLAQELSKKTAITAAKQQALTRMRPSSAIYPPTMPIIPLPSPAKKHRIYVPPLKIKALAAAESSKWAPKAKKIESHSQAVPVEKPKLARQLTHEEKFQNAKELKGLMSMAESGLNSRFSDMYKAFQYVDLDRSGRLSRTELRRALDLWNIPVDDAKLDLLMGECDADGDGGVSYEEFVDKLARETVAPDAMGKRGMQSAEAMGVDAYELMDQQLGHGGIKKYNVSINA